MNQSENTMNQQMTESRMIQLMLLSLNISSDVIRAFMHNVILKPYENSLEKFLSNSGSKHILFHIYSRAKCCQKCGQAPFPQGGQILSTEQFRQLYTPTSRSPCIPEGCSQQCVCIYEPNSTVDVNELDITLILCLLNNCCRVSDFISGCIDHVRQIRNFICHAKRFSAYKINQVEEKIKDIEYNILQLAKEVKIPEYATNIQKQIILVKMGTFKWDDVKAAFTHTDSATKKVVNAIEEARESLKVYTKSLKDEIITSHKEEIHSVKNAIEQHCAEQTSETKEAFDSFKADVLEDNTHQSEHLVKEMIDLHGKQSSHLDTVYTRLSENQDNIMSTQKDHTSTLSTVEHATSEIHKQQSETTKDVSYIRGTISDLQPSLVDFATASNTLKNISIDIPENKPLVVTCKPTKRDSETQTDIEYIELKLGHATEKVINAIEESKESLKVYTHSLKNEIITNHKEEINSVKNAIVQHYTEQTSETKEALELLKTDVLQDNTLRSEHLVQEMKDLHNEQRSHLDTVCTCLSENQNSIMSTQKDHTFSLDKIEQGTEIHKQQSDNTKCLSYIRETINDLEPNLEGFATASNLLKNVSTDITELKRLQNDSQTQTNIENIEFELIYERETRQTMKSKEDDLTAIVELIMDNFSEIKRNQSDCSDILKECKVFITNSCYWKKGVHQDRQETRRRSEFQSKIIKETIEINADLATLLVNAPLIFCSLNSVLKKRDTFHMLLWWGLRLSRTYEDIYLPFFNFFKILCNRTYTIWEEIFTVLLRTEILIVLKNDNNRNSIIIPESFSDNIMPIIQVLSNLKYDADEIETVAKETLSSVTTCKDYFETYEAETYFSKFTFFFRSFGRQIKMVRELSSILSTCIQRQSSSDSSVMAQFLNLYKAVMGVKHMCDCYLLMYRDHLSISILTILWSTESFDYDKEVKATIKAVNLLVDKQNSALEEHLQEVFHLI